MWSIRPVDQCSAFIRTDTLTPAATRYCFSHPEARHSLAQGLPHRPHTQRRSTSSSPKAPDQHGKAPAPSRRGTTERRLLRGVAVESKEEKYFPTQTSASGPGGQARRGRCHHLEPFIRRQLVLARHKPKRPPDSRCSWCMWPGATQKRCRAE